MNGDEKPAAWAWGCKLWKCPVFKSFLITHLKWETLNRVGGVSEKVEWQEYPCGWGDYILSMKCHDKWVTCCTHSTTVQKQHRKKRTYSGSDNTARPWCLTLHFISQITLSGVNDAVYKVLFFLLYNAVQIIALHINQEHENVVFRKMFGMWQYYKIKGFGQHHLLSREWERVKWTEKISAVSSLSEPSPN